MGYYIYRNWRAQKTARIHKAECGQCKMGKGCHLNPRGKENGEWSKRFKNLKDAENDARKLYKGKRLKLKYCKTCKPEKS